MLRIERVYLEYARMSGEDERSHFCEDRHPQIGWTLVSGRPNDHQEYVQMRFKDERGNLIWDSGKRMERAQRMRYEGEGLPEGEEILLELTVWNVYGEQSPSYCDHLFYVGKEEWTAKWIGMRDDAEEGVVLLKKDFEIDRQVAGARLYACGIGYHKIYLDGALLDHAELDPAFTDYRKQCQYIFIPGIEKRLKAGRHTLCARIAPGWRYNPGTERLIGNIPGFSGAKQFTAMLEIEYADGSKALMETDESWLAAPDRIRRASVFDGTILDASITGAQFVQAEVLSPPGGKMRPMLIPSICEGETHDAIASWVIEGKGILMDFGSNLSGVLRVALPDDLKKGQKIRLSHAEELTLDGAPFYDTLRGAKAEDIYIASGDENDLEIWQPEFTYHGFRYAMIEGVDASFDVNRIKAIELYTKLERIGDFRCGSALVTRIHEMCVATEKGNMHSILTDCPQRDERMQWLNDATVRFEEIPYNFEV